MAMLHPCLVFLLASDIVICCKNFGDHPFPFQPCFFHLARTVLVTQQVSQLCGSEHARCVYLSASFRSAFSFFPRQPESISGSDSWSELRPARSNASDVSGCTSVAASRAKSCLLRQNEHSYLFVWSQRRLVHGCPIDT